MPSKLPTPLPSPAIPTYPEPATLPVDRAARRRSLLISGSYFPPQIGGISTMMYEICRELGPDRVAVLTGVAGTPADAPLEKLKMFRVDDCLPPRSVGSSMRLVAALGRALVAMRPAVLQYATLEDAYLAYWTRRALGLRHIFYAHGNELLAAAKSPWDKARSALLASSCVVANSRFTAELARSFGLPAERVRVVHPGCNVQEFYKMSVDAETRARITQGRPRARVLLTVGNLVERKGHDTVIRALSALPPGMEDTLYLIAGEGPYRQALEELAQSLGVAERVRFLGRVEKSDLPLLYSLADAFVMVARERKDNCDVEGFGIVFIEAAACGIPVIAGRSGGVEDAVMDGVTGLLVDPLDTGEVARAIAALLAKADLARELGESGRRRAIAQFTWSRFGRDVAAILEEVCNA